MSGALPSTGDVEWQLFSPNSIIQSQGFSNLLTLLKLSKDYAERKTAVNLLWKALNSGSEALCNWIILIFPCLIDTEIICKDEIRKQCLIALTNQHSVTPIIRFLISNCDDITVCVLSVIRQIVCENINEVLLALEQIPMERCFACVMRLVLGAEISNEQKNQLIHHTITRGSYEHVQILLEFDDVIPYYMISLAEESEARNLLMLRRAELYSRDVLSTIRLDYKRCLFALCDQLVSKSFSNSLELLQNATFPRHPILLSSLYTLYSCLSEWSHNSSMPKLMGRDSLEIVKNLLNITKSVKLEDDGNFRGEEEISMNGNLADYLEWIYGSDEHCLNTFLEIWAERARSLVTNLSVNFLVGLLPKISDDNIRYFINLFVLFADKNPSLVNEIFLVVLSLYSRADLPKIPILECIARIGVSKYVVRRALKFLLVISQQRSKCEERLKAVELVGNVWSRNENLLDEIAQLTTTVDDTKGDLKFEHAKMSLIRRICSQSDRAEEFLPRLSALSNSNGPLLADAVYAIADLCRSEVLDVSAVLKQMDTRMQNTNCEEALVAYCDLLSTSASDPEQEEVILDCIRKLWRLKSHRAAEVRAAVWRALSAFDLPEVKRALEGIEAGLMLSTCIQTIANDKQSTLLEQKIVAEEFGKFLHKMIACELEEFGRSLYTAYEGSARQQNSALLETISDFKDLASKTSEMAHLRMLSAWTISSGAESVQVKRTSAIMQHLYQLLTKVNVPRTNSDSENWRSVLEYLSSWKMAIGAAYDAVLNAKRTHPGREPPKHWARDQLCETMKQALQQSECAQINVCASLAFLLEKSEFDKPWAVAAMEYLLSCCSAEHVCRASPLFQQKISYARKAEWMNVQRLAICLFYIKLDSETLSQFAGNIREEILNSKELLNEEIGEESNLDFDGSIGEWVQAIMQNDDSSDAKSSEEEKGDNSSESSGGVASLIAYLLRFEPLDVNRVDSVCTRSEAVTLGYVTGANPLMLACLLDEMRMDLAAEERFLDLNRSQKMTIAETETFFEVFANMSADLQQKYSSALVKRTVQEMKRNRDNARMINVIIKGLTKCYLCELALSDGVSSLPQNYKVLPEDSVLRSAVYMLISGCFKKRTQSELLKAILNSLRDQKRKSDARVLPPLEWSTFLSDYYRYYCLSRDGESGIEVSLIAITIQQRVYKLLCRILSAHRRSALSLDAAYVIASNLSKLQSDLSRFQMKFIIELLFETAELNGFDGNILGKLAEISVENGDVVEKWSKKIPPIERAASVRHPLYERFMNVTIPERIYAQSSDNINGNENAMLAVWCISKDIVRSSKVEQLRVLIGYLKLIEMKERATALLIAMYNFELIASLEERLRLLLQLISLSRVDGHSLKDNFIYWRVFIALCSSEPNSLEIPCALFSFGDDWSTWNRIESCICERFRALITTDTVKCQICKISYFFIDIIMAIQKVLGAVDKDGTCKRVLWRVKALLRQALTTVSRREIIESLEETDLWNTIFL